MKNRASKEAKTRAVVRLLRELLANLEGQPPQLYPDLRAELRDEDDDSDDSDAEQLRERRRTTAFVYGTDSSTDSDEEHWRASGVPIVKRRRRTLREPPPPYAPPQYWAHPQWAPPNWPAPSAPPAELVLGPAMRGAPPPPPPPPPPPALGEPRKLVITKSAQPRGAPKKESAVGGMTSGLLAELKSVMARGVKRKLRAPKPESELPPRPDTSGPWDRLMSSIRISRPASPVVGF